MRTNKHTSREPLSVPPNILDIKIQDFRYKITPVNVRKFNQVVSEGTEKPEATIHPVYFTKISWQILENLDRYIIGDINKKILTTMVHQSEYLVFHKPLGASAEVIVESQFWSISSHKKGSELIIKFDFYCDEELVATEFSSGILFGVNYKGGEQKKDDLPTTRPVDSMPIWEKTIGVDRQLPFSYAEEAEIDAPIHTNEEFAKSIGLPDIILQGTCTFAKAISLILHHAPLKTEASITSVAAKFTGMLVPPNTITVCLLVQDETGLYFDVKNDQGQIIIKGGQILFSSAMTIDTKEYCE